MENNERKFEEYVKKAFDLWGEDAQYLQLMEELDELGVAANHLRRGREGSIENFKKEICDVFMMICEFIIYHNISEEEIEELYDKIENGFYDKVDRTMKKRKQEETTGEVAESG